MYEIMGIPATRYDSEIVEHVDALGTPLGTYDLSGVILWVGVNAHAVSALVNGGACIETAVRLRLQAMLDNDEISIDREYAVSASVTVTCTVEQTVEARSESAAADLVHEMVNDGDVYGLFDDHTIDDIDITDVEAA